MSRTAATFGIHPDAVPAWLSLAIALDRMADAGRLPVCKQRPDQWSSDVPEHARKDAAEACHYCPAKSACHAFALANREKSGVWGGHDFTPITTTRKAVA